MKIAKLHESNVLLDRSKKQKKNNIGRTSGCTLNPDAGDVEHNVAMFNHMSNLVGGPSVNPCGPMAEDMTTDEISHLFKLHVGDIVEYEGQEFTVDAIRNDPDHTELVPSMLKLGDRWVPEEWVALNFDHKLREDSNSMDSLIELNYHDLEVPVVTRPRRPSSYHFEYDSDEAQTVEETIDYTFSVPRADVVDFIYENMTENDFADIDTATEAEVLDFIDKNFDSLFAKYESMILDSYRDRAREDASRDMNESVNTRIVVERFIRSLGKSLHEAYQTKKIDNNTAAELVRLSKLHEQYARIDDVVHLNKIVEKVKSALMSCADDVLAEGLADRIRKNDLDYDRSIDAWEASEGDTSIQLQDRELHTHELRTGTNQWGKSYVTGSRNTHPKVSTSTWGRVWKDGELTRQFKGSKYQVRADMAKYLDDEKQATSRVDSMNEGTDYVTRYRMEYWFNDDDEDDEDGRNVTLIYADSEEEAEMRLYKLVGDDITITAAFPETVPAEYKRWDMGEEWQDEDEDEGRNIHVSFDCDIPLLMTETEIERVVHKALSPTDLNTGYVDILIRDESENSPHAHISFTVNAPSYMAERDVEDVISNALASTDISSGYLDVHALEESVTTSSSRVQKVNEANYGGAFDIDPEVYFTRDDLVEFADGVISALEEEIGIHLDICALYIEGNNITLELTDTVGCEFDHTVTFRVDMRKIRVPRDLGKYTTMVVRNFADEYRNLQSMMTESRNAYHSREYTVINTGYSWRVKDGSGKWVGGEFDTDSEAQNYIDSLNESFYEFEDEEESEYELIDFEDDEDEPEYELINRKRVLDHGGFLDEYSWYRDSNGLNVFVFGDSDIYRPESGDFDHEEEDDLAAQEWFDAYGQDDENPDDLYENWKRGAEVTLWWKDPSWSADAPSYATCSYVGKSADGSHKFRSTTYGDDYLLDVAKMTVTTPAGKTFDVDNSSGWLKNASSLKEDYNVQFYKILQAPTKPTENGKVIGQRGDLESALAFGYERCGKGNFLIHAVCDDGKVRDVDLYSYFNESVSVTEEDDNKTQSTSKPNSLKEWNEFSDDEVEDALTHANVYGGDSSYCPVCGADKAYDEDGFAYCPECSREEQGLVESTDEDDDDGKTVSVAFDVNIPTSMTESELEQLIRKALGPTDAFINSYMEIHTLDESLKESFWYNDAELRAEQDKLVLQLERDGWQEVDSREESGRYYTFFRKIVNGIGQWKAVVADTREHSSSVIDVSYAQARGQEPLSNIGALRQRLGNILLQ